jgi:oligopeptide/dipeptide ABC transporter ATP-binding protein
VTAPLLDVRDLRVGYPVRADGKRAWLHAVAGVSFEVPRGKTLGLVGESGCGKSTTARAILGLTPATGGEIRFEGSDLLGLGARALRQARRDIQCVFQDPYASFNPRMRIDDIVMEPLVVHRIGTRRERRARVRELLDVVGLGAHIGERRPSELSGGQRQRVGIARALAVRPKLVIADEPVSALDVSVQAQVLNLMMDLQDEFGLAYVFISHDLGVVQHVSDRIGVMYLGRIVELAPADAVCEQPRHPYTRALLSAVPEPSVEAPRARLRLGGEVPNPVDPPSGCVFHTRCPWAEEACAGQAPGLMSVRPGHGVACRRDPVPIAAPQHAELSPAVSS